MQNKAACDILCINHLYEVKDMKTGLWIAVLSMGGVIAAIMEAMFPREGKNRYQWQPRPGRGYAVTEEGYREIP